MKNIFIKTSLLLTLLFPNILLAYTKNTTSVLSQTLSVKNSCLIISSDNISFGNYIPSSLSQLQNSGQLKVTCTKGTVVTAYPTSGGSIMTNGSNNMNYGLFQDTGFTKLLGSNNPSIYQNINLSSPVRFNDVLTTGFANCQTLSNGTVFAYRSSVGMCLYGYNSASSTYMDGPYNGSSTNGVTYMNGTVVKSANYGAWNLYIPNDSKLVSGYTWNIETTLGTGMVVLSGVSAVEINSEQM